MAHQCTKAEKHEEMELARAMAEMTSSYQIKEESHNITVSASGMNERLTSFGSYSIRK